VRSFGALLEATLMQTTWERLRLKTGLKQREVERRLGWLQRGHLSQIERGLHPTPEQEEQLVRFYALTLPEETTSASAE
jgi:transcriptional regulator with XRE-family HTH domain